MTEKKPTVELIRTLDDVMPWSESAEAAEVDAACSELELQTRGIDPCSSAGLD